MDEERLYYIEPSDPLFHAKSVSIQSHNQIVDLIKENKKGMHDKLYYIFSLYIAIITGLYIQLALTYLSFFIISNVFLIVWRLLLLPFLLFGLFLPPRKSLTLAITKPFFAL